MTLANAERMKFFVQALCMTGLFLALALPVLVYGADEATTTEAVSQSVIETTVQINDQAIVATSTSDQVSAPAIAEIIASTTVITTTSLAPMIVGAIVFAKNTSQSVISDEIGGDSTASIDQETTNQSTAISDEFSDTSAGNNSGTTTTEGGFTTTGSNGGTSTPVVSDEVSFVTTAESNGGTSTPVISNEVSFDTTSGPNGGGGQPVISDEVSFVTTGGGGGGRTEVVSEEMSFTTTVFTGVISDEVSFDTLPGGGGGGGGCTSNCGGGGGGGGGGPTIIPPVLTTFVCKPFLLEYIKWGMNNNPYEVRKLQAFLIVFEKENRLTVSGYYDRATFEAVERFQKKYGPDVLGPWGITDSTGYVFITTKLAINNVYCARSTANDLDLRHYYDQIENLIRPAQVVATTTVASTTFGVATTTFLPTIQPGLGRLGHLFQLAFAGALDFLRYIPCWLWNLILLLLIILLLLVIWYLSEDDDDEYFDDLDHESNSFAESEGSAVIAPIGDTIEEEKEYEVLPVVETKDRKTGK